MTDSRQVIIGSTEPPEFAMENNTAIHISGLGKCYQVYARPLDRLKQAVRRGRKRYFTEFWALTDIDLTIRKGETVGIIGANGSGKSTLLQLMCGTVRPTVGEIAIDGRVSALLELGAGFNPEFTGRENVFMNAAIMGLSREETEARMAEILEFADIGPFIDQPVKTYSSGMYVRLAFAVSINVSPDILIIDEALSVGDARFQQNCMTRIKHFCRNGTVVFVSHDMTAVLELCSRAVWIKDGRIEADDKPKPVVEKYLQYMYGGTPPERFVETATTAVGETDLDGEGFSPIDTGYRQYGDQRVRITKVGFTSTGGDGRVAFAGQPCELRMIVRAAMDIPHPILGFSIMDRLGRRIFGQQHFPPPLKKGGSYLASFIIKEWPNLVEGDYVVTFGVSDGNRDAFVVCHFVFDALVIRSVPVEKPAVGIFSLPDSGVVFQELDLPAR